MKQPLAFDLIVLLSFWHFLLLLPLRFLLLGTKREEIPDSSSSNSINNSSGLNLALGRNQVKQQLKQLTSLAASCCSSLSCSKWSSSLYSHNNVKGEEPPTPPLGRTSLVVLLSIGLRVNDHNKHNSNKETRLYNTNTNTIAKTLII